MKKIFFLFLTFFLLWAFSAVAFAQNKSSTENYQEFLKDYRTYQGLIEPFNTRKSRHLAYQTVSTQAELLGATRNLILAEIDSQIAYTAFIRSLLAEATQVLEYRENYLYVKLDDEMAFLNLAKGRAQSLSSLNEAGQLLADLSSHYQKISKMGYQIKALVEVESVKKIFANLKIEKDKLQAFLSGEREATPKILAVREKLVDLEKEISACEELITKAEGLQKNFDSQNPKDLAGETRRTVEQAVAKMNILVLGYKNIVFSLK